MLSIYLHIPFCTHRCSYCDFNTYAGQERWIPAYMEALAREVALVAQAGGEAQPVHTVFFGGGTPSLVPVEYMGQVLEIIRSSFDLQADAEISLEANPGTLSPGQLDSLRAMGFNRISFGAQSAHPDDLRLLERLHDFPDVIRAVESARKAGFDNLSLDLMFGLPDQPLERWQETVEHVARLRPEHVSMYALTIEANTPFGHRFERGLIPGPDDDLAAEMYEWADRRLEQAGYRNYEISNWAFERGGGWMEARHNLQYWRGLPYLGFGAGAHGYAAGVRTVNAFSIPEYIRRAAEGHAGVFPSGPAAIQAVQVDAWNAMQETMMVGLRLTREGVPHKRFARQFGITLQDAFGRQIDPLVRQGLLEWAEGPAGECLRLTPPARLLGNRVFSEFVGLPEPKGLLSGASTGQ